MARVSFSRFPSRENRNYCCAMCTHGMAINIARSEHGTAGRNQASGDQWLVPDTETEKGVGSRLSEALRGLTRRGRRLNLYLNLLPFSSE